MKKIFLSTLLLTSFISSSQTLVTFTPSKDVSLGYHDNYQTANTNYNNAYQLAGYVIDGTMGGLNKNRALVAFDLSSIPTGSTIDNATISFFSFNNYTVAPLTNGQQGNNSCYLQRVTEDWDQNVVTWNTQPNSISTDELILPQSTAAVQDYLDMDVTATVQYFVNNPNQNFGYKFGLIDETLGNNLSFHSSESTDPAKKPLLKVTYRPSTAAVINLEDPTLIISPNPVKDILSLTFSNSFNIEKIKIVDMNGKVVKDIETSLKLDKINVSELSTGVYNICYESNNKMTTIKFIKE